MRYTQIEELKARVATILDVQEFLDILGWTMFDLVDNLDPDVFDDNFEELERACD